MTNIDDIDNNDLFNAELVDVKPLKQDKILPKNKKNKPTQAQLARQQSATNTSEVLSEYLTLDNAPMLKPDDVLHFRRNGVQEGVYRKLRLGKYPIQARLDLHNFTLEQARNEILSFIRKCLKMDIRTVIIVHGKGEHLRIPALIKSYVATWLPELSEVLCFHSALPYHGGTGAVYILLKKSESKKLENREQHKAGRS